MLKGLDWASYGTPSKMCRRKNIAKKVARTMDKAIMGYRGDTFLQVVT